MTNCRKTLRVLLVEDSADDAELVRLTLAEAGYAANMMQVATRAAVETCLAEMRWDVILCDHNLPGMDSLEVLRIACDTKAAAPFLILSGSIPDDQAIEAMRRGARDFIHKDMLGKLIPVIERELATIDMAGELHRLTDDLRRLADFDPLTGLPNRENLLRYLGHLEARHAGGGAEFGLLLLDINRFRNISRSLGPECGDRVIAEVARRIVAAAGSADFVARSGGDSFALVAPCADGRRELLAQAEALAVQAGLPMHVGDYELFVTLSIGACVFPEGADCAERLFANAEAALFRAKQTGGGCCQLFHPSMLGHGTREIAIEGALHRALKNREFVLHYQPQIDLASGRMVSVEALLRWRHPEWGLVAPGEFVPLLEETGLIVPAGEWIIESACAQLRAWDKAGIPDLRMAVNLSALQFEDARLVAVVEAALRRHAIAPERLELEITENIVMEGREEAIAVLKRLRDLGVRIAVDDFGTGYSSLGYLKRFPITTLKIDQMFVRECADSPRDRALVETMVQMGKRLALEIVAEGVETEEQADFLASLDCDLAQGYLYGKPMPPEALSEFLRRERSWRPPEGHAVSACPGMALVPS